MDPIVELQQGWRQGFAGQRLGQHLRGWGEREPALARFHGDTERLLRFLATPPGRERDAVFCALLRRARHDELAGQLLLEALLPGLKSLVRRLLFEPSERDELWAVVLTCAWEQIRRYPTERRPARVAANLLLDTQHAALRELRRKPGEPPTVPLNTGKQKIEPAASERHDDVVVVLHRAVKAGAITTEEALLILYTRVGGWELAALAEADGVAYDAMRLRRRRAERRLLLFLGEAGVRFEGRNRHICTARSVAFEVADSASGGAGT